MAKNPWADEPNVKATSRSPQRGTPRASMRSQRGSAPWAGLLVALALVAFGTFIFGFYLPLYRSHQTAVASYERFRGQVKALEDTLTQAQATLKSEIAKRETLEAEKRQREGASKGSAGELESVRATIAQKLEGPISKKQAGVALEGDRVVVVLGSGALFSTGKVEVSGGGKNLLCDVAKAAGPRMVRVDAATDADGVPAMLKIKYTSAWALTGAAASSVANTLEEKCSVQGPKLSASGYAENKPPRKALEATKIGGLRIELEIGGPERKP